MNRREFDSLMDYMKYSDSFNRDFLWYLKMRHTFTFAGRDFDIYFDVEGVDGKKAFLLFDSKGITSPTKHPNLFKTILKVKASINLHIKMYAEDRAKGVLPRMEFINLCENLEAPKWFIEAVENQKYKHYEKTI